MNCISSRVVKACIGRCNTIERFFFACVYVFSPSSMSTIPGYAIYGILSTCGKYLVLFVLLASYYKYMGNKLHSIG